MEAPNMQRSPLTLPNCTPDMFRELEKNGIRTIGDMTRTRLAVVAHVLTPMTALRLQISLVGIGLSMLDSDEQLPSSATSVDVATIKKPAPMSFEPWRLKDYLPIVRPRSGSQVIRAVVLGDGIDLQVHYTKQHGSVPCVAGCQFCPYPARPKRYLPVAYRLEINGHVPQEVMEPGCLEVTGDWIGSIRWERGLIVRAWTAAKKWQYAAGGQWPATSQLPRMFAVVPYLEKIFGMTIRFEGEEAGERPDTIPFVPTRKQA